MYPPMANRMAATPSIGTAPFMRLNTGCLRDNNNIPAGTTYPPSPGAHNGWGAMIAAIANERKASLITACRTKAVRTHATAIAIAPTPTHLTYKSTPNPFPTVSGTFHNGEFPVILLTLEWDGPRPCHPVTHLFKRDAVRSPLLLSEAPRPPGPHPTREGVQRVAPPSPPLTASQAPKPVNPGAEPVRLQSRAYLISLRRSSTSANSTALEALSNFRSR